MSSLEEKILERELTKAQIENKRLKELIDLRISYEAELSRKVVRLCELANIPFNEVIEYFARREI